MTTIDRLMAMGDYYSLEQLRDEVAKARREAIEECAESIDDACREQIMTASDCIDLIRNIK